MFDEETKVGSAPHADHYNQLKPQPIEVVEAWTHLPYHLHEALIHIARVGVKGPIDEWIKDLDKAAWYCKRYATILRQKQPVETQTYEVDGPRMYRGGRFVDIDGGLIDEWGDEEK